jgi:uncharacterized membrane protein
VLNEKGGALKAYLCIVALLHGFFCVAELFPWRMPLALWLSLKQLKPRDDFSPAQQDLVATIVHNAAIYNAIVAGGLVYAAMSSPHGDVARVMLLGAAGAGVFGALTLRSTLAALQAVLGIIGLYLAK